MRIIYIFFILTVPLLFMLPCSGAEKRVEAVFQEDSSLRSLAQEYLGNPDEWEFILFYNGFQHPEQLKPGTGLHIPVSLYQRTMEILADAVETSQKANMEGAGVLAKGSIAKAEGLYKQAMYLKKKGELAAAEKKAAESLQWAEKALTEAKEKKIRSVSALLARKQGSVQSRRPEEPVWSDAEIEQELTEKERLRTLAKSAADILFTDDSMVRMAENSLAVIGEMKENRIRRSFSAGIVVLEGDVLAHISSLGSRKDIRVTTPGVKTEVRSKKFRTSRDRGQVTRIANYDGEIDVEANRRRVKVKKNEGTRVEYGKGPESPRKLLPPPRILSPVPGQTFYKPEIRMEWEKTEKAVRYQIEIGRDRDFTEITDFARTDKSFYEWEKKDRGIFYFRIFSIDPENFAGPFSETVEFYADTDKSPPFLSLHSPEENQILLSHEVRVEGNTEKQAEVRINDLAVTIDDKGAFSHAVPLREGENIIRVLAEDRAGNISRLERKVICNREERMIRLDTPPNMVLNSPQLTVKGRIRPHTLLEIGGKEIAASDHFSHVLTLPEGEHVIAVRGRSPSGETEENLLHIRVDLTAPEIRSETIADMTRESRQMLSGSISEEAELEISGEPVPVRDRKFRIPLELKEGQNLFLLQAADPAGNRSQKQFRILLDTTAPEVKQSRCSPKRVKGGEIVMCEISVSDSGSGPARTGSFSISLIPGMQYFAGILSLNREKEIFEGSVFVPPGVQGRVKIRSFQIQDRLGNEIVGPHISE
ncbi:MAG: FecR domain-containing protein [Desulfococcaceae bacterium]|jgi:hypothetical protein|nr:FecR domain-containing protein [Desulfococcaceae bacterium]